MDTTIKNIELKNNNMEGTDFQGCTHEKLDISTNEIAGIICDSKFLKELTIDLYQSSYILPMFGIEVKE